MASVAATLLLRLLRECHLLLTQVSSLIVRVTSRARRAIRAPPEEEHLSIRNFHIASIMEEEDCISSILYAQKITTLHHTPPPNSTPFPPPFLSEDADPVLPQP